jgi:peptide/nickel transport system ATP-binding protein
MQNGAPSSNGDRRREERFLLQVQLNEGHALLQAKDLCVSFQESRRSFIRAVNHVSFDVREGEVLSIVGESGSGKTTIARCVSALTPISSGSLLFRGEDVSSFRGDSLLNYRRDVQMIFQDPYESLNPRWNVFTTIATHLNYLGRNKERSQILDFVARLLEEVGLNPDAVMYRFPHQLSGGERQRVNIARALSPSPSLLLADEPITMLDASQRLNILRLLLQLKEKRNLTVVLITHDLASANVASDRTLIMYRGNLVEIGPTKSVLSKPLHPYTKLILDSMPDIEFKPQAEEKSVAIEEKVGDLKGCIFRPRCKYATEVCERLEPELLEKSTGHLSACHNSSQLS